MRDELIRAVRTRFEPDSLYLTWPAVVGVSASERFARLVSLRWERAAELLLESLRLIEREDEDPPRSAEEAGSPRRRRSPTDPLPRPAARRRDLPRSDIPQATRAGDPSGGPSRSPRSPGSKPPHASRSTRSGKPGSVLPPRLASGAEALEDSAPPDGDRAVPPRHAGDPEATGHRAAGERAASDLSARGLPRADGPDLPEERLPRGRPGSAGDTPSGKRQVPGRPAGESPVAPERAGMPGALPVPGGSSEWPGETGSGPARSGPRAVGGPQPLGEIPAVRLPNEEPWPGGPDTEARITERLRREAALREWEATGF